LPVTSVIFMTNLWILSSVLKSQVDTQSNICGVEYTGFLDPNEHKIFTMENHNLNFDFPL